MFLLKKYISTLFEPLNILLILLLITLFYIMKKNNKKAKKFFFISFFWFFIISSTNISNILLIHLEYHYPTLKNPPKDIKYILVLGHGHKSDNYKPINSQISKTALVRLSEGIRLYRKIKGSKLILSGYAGYNKKEKIPHAIMQKKVALSLGVNPKDIILQTKPKDTKEEALNVKKIIGHSKLILVTSASHILRAMKIFHSVGLHPIAAPTDFLSSKDSSFISLPNTNSIKNMQIAIHEYLGIIWNRLTIWYKSIKNIKIEKL